MNPLATCLYITPDKARWQGPIKPLMQAGGSSGATIPRIFGRGSVAFHPSGPAIGYICAHGLPF